MDASNLELISRLNKIILGFTHLDNMVVLGRGGFAVLREYADVMHVRIQAPFDVRVQRLVQQENLTAAEAKKQVQQNDKARSSFVKGFYNADFYNTRSFNLVLDSDLIPIETAIQWIVETARALDARTFENVLTTDQIVVEPILAGAIQQVLEPL